MVAHKYMFYFGDQSAEPYTSLADLLKEKKESCLLALFLRSCFEALQDEVRTLAPHERKLFQGRDFGQLADHIRISGIQHVAVNSPLTCVIQLGWLLIHREREPEAHHHENCIFLGVCTGSLAAVAAATTRSDSDLLQIAPYFTRISLRLGVEVSRRSSALDASPGSWSVSASGLALDVIQDEIQRFNKDKNISSLKQVYISARSFSAVTVSGPPSHLLAFLSRESLQHVHQLPLPVFGAFHAAHLPLPDLDFILGEALFLERPAPKGVLCHSDVPTDSTVGSLLRSVVVDFLSRSLDVDRLVEKACSYAPGCDICLTSIGPAYMRGLIQQLRPAAVSRWGSGHMPTSQDTILALQSSQTIAVVGMAGRFPGAENLEELWKIFLEGRDVHQMIPKDRFDVATHVDPTGNKKNTSLTPHGCFYDGVGDFDTALFKMSPREAAQTDPMQRLMLITAYEALESSGYYDNGDQATRPMNGTFYGVAGDDYRNANSSQDIDTNYITGGIRAFGPGRVSYYLGWEGPSMSVDTACSASGVAIHQAITSLRLRECDLALAGGTNLLSCSDLFAGLSRANFVSATGSCKTFDETADGYCRADGFASVVLKRFTDAVQDKDNILGVIRSVETHHAGTAISLTHPEADTQIALFRKVLCGAGLTIDDIDHVELHGTGTQAGDLAESTAVAGMLDGPRPRDRPLTISSVKPNIGHSEAASGVSSLIKGLQMLQHQVIPRHIGIKKRLNPKLPPLEPLNIVIPSTNMPYHALNRDGRRRMLVNNFNATGGITAMLLEEHVTESLQAKDPRGTYPITLSAATPAALDRSQARLLDYLRSHPQTNVSHLSYTLTARRLHHKHRFSCVAESLDDLTRILAAISSESTARTLKSAEQPFPVFVFTGQTSTLPQAKTLFETNGPFREQLLRLDSLCLSMGLPSFLQVISGDDAEYRSVQKQLALIALEISLAILFQTWGITPSAVIGHSLGEYTALCMSKVISIADALWLVGKRGLLLESKCVTNAYSMIVVALAVEDTKLVLRDFPECEVACINAPKQTVVSGADEDIVALAKHLKSKGVRATNVNVPYGFHSKQVEIIRDEYLEILQGIRFQRPAVPFASTLLGKVVTDENVVDAEYLSRQTREAVCFQSALEKLETFVEDGQKPLWVELGPSPACAPMIVSTLQVRPENILAALHPKKPDWATIGEVVSRYYLSNGTVRWDEYHKQHLDALELLQLPSYPFDLKRYWIQYNGDWIIRKDQASQQMGEKAPCGADLGSITLQCLESTIVEKGVRKLTFAAGVERPCVQVDGATKSTPSSILAADMALASALHLCRLYGHPPYLMALSHMRLSRLLSDRRSTAKVVATQQPTDTNVIDVSIVTSNAAEVTEHAQCRVIVGNGEDWVSEARRSAYLYQSRIDLLQLFESHGQSKRLAGTDAYKFVDNEDESHVGIEDVLLNTNSLEAVAHVRTARCEVGYQCNPHWLGALIDVPSVVINASRHIRYECVGWQTLRFLPVEVGRRYAVHTRMQLHEDSGLIKGDVHALDGNGGIVAVIEQLVFRPTAAVKPEYLNISTHPAQGAPNSFLATEVQDHEVSETSNGGISVDMSDSPRSVHEAPARHVAASPRPEPTQNQEKRASKVHFDTVLHVIAAEIGVETETLTDDTILEDLGIDSII